MSIYTLRDAHNERHLTWGAGGHDHGDDGVTMRPADCWPLRDLVVAAERLARRNAEDALAEALEARQEAEERLREAKTARTARRRPSHR